MKRFGCISGIGLFFVLMLSGCASSQLEAPVADEQLINNNIKVIGVTSQIPEVLPITDLLQKIKKISVITPEGSELELNYNFWTDHILHNLDRLSETTRSNQSYLYTLILRTDSGSPLLMQIGNESLTVGETTYTGDILPQLMLDIRGAIGKRLISDIKIDQLSVFMLDVANYPVDFASEDMEELRRVIESATFIHESTDLQHPLFPHYVIQILDGDKSVVHLDIIGNNMISIPYGKDQTFYYHLSENLYAKFYRILPPFDFSDDNPKALFNATAIQINSINDESLQFGHKDTVDTVSDSITDSFARLLVDGNKLIHMEDQQEELFVLSFSGLDYSKEVKIFANGYTYRDRYYQLPDIGEKVRKHIDSLK